MSSPLSFQNLSLGLHHISADESAVEIHLGFSVSIQVDWICLKEISAVPRAVQSGID